MDMGYSFHWEAGRNPVLVTPEGNIIPLVVEKHIPYMIVGDEESLPRPPNLYRKVPVAPAVNNSVLDSLESVGEQYQANGPDCDDKSSIATWSSSDEEDDKSNDEEAGKTVVTKLPDVMSCNEGVLPKVESEKAQEMAEVSLTRDEKLKAEAKSLQHKLHHLPKNPFCEACMRGKMREKYSRRGAFQRETEKW